MKRLNKTSVLRRPVKLKRLGPVELTEAYERKVKELLASVEAAIDERVHAVEEQYGAAPETLKAMIAHAPGFQVVWSDKKDGRPVRWGPMQLLYLWLDVRQKKKEKEKKKEKCSERTACTFLCSAVQGRQEYKGLDPATLRERLIEAKSSPLVKHMQDLVDRIQEAEDRSKRERTIGRGIGHVIEGNRYRLILESLLRPETRAELLQSNHPERLLTKLLRPALY
jgi:hypothetical protein